MRSEIDEIKDLMAGPQNFVQLPKHQIKELIFAIEVLRRLVALREKRTTGQQTEMAWTEARSALDRLGIR